MKQFLAVNGGSPIRTKGWPDMYPGGMLYDDEEVDAAVKVLKAQSPFRHYGIDLQHQVDRFEKAMAQFTGTKYALGVASGSTALTVALAALGIGPGKEVIIPGLMWISVVNSIVHLRAIPVLCEIDDTWNMNPQDLENCITERTSAIIAVHMAGTAADIISISNLAKEHNIPVLEDCSQASGASVNGKRVGSFGEIATFSLQYNKNITTGEGGMITTSNEELYRKCVSFQDVGFERDEDGISVPKNTPFESFGVGCRLDEIRGAIGLVQLRKLPETCKMMRGHQQNIKNALLKIPGIRWRRMIDAEGDSGYCLGWILENKNKVKPFLEAMQAEGIPVTTAPGGVHQYRYMTNLMSKIGVTTKGCPWTCPFNKESIVDFSTNTLPKSNDILDRSLMLTMPPLLTEQDEGDAVKAFKKVAGEIM